MSGWLGSGLYGFRISWGIIKGSELACFILYFCQGLFYLRMNRTKLTFKPSPDVLVDVVTLSIYVVSSLILSVYSCVVGIVL